MDTKLKNNRKIGSIVVLLLLAACAFIMMAQYDTISRILEADSENQTIQEEVFFAMGYDLAQGNYLLYNEYANVTPTSEVIEEYGQPHFELLRKYMDYCVFASGAWAAEETEESSTAETYSNADAAGVERLSDLTEENYAFRAVFEFTESGEIADVRVDGSEVEPGTAYDLENYYIDAAMDEEEGDISDIATPSGVTVIYGMTEDNLNAYAEKVEPDMSYEEYGVLYTGAYRDTLEMLALLVVIAALLLPLSKRMDISGWKMFRAPFEILLIIFFCSGILLELPAVVVYNTIEGTLIPGMGHGMELMAGAFNFLMWMFVFGVIFWGVTCVRAVFRMKSAYWKERTLTARLIRHIRKRGDEDDETMKERAGGLWERFKTFLDRQYDALLHIDFREKTNRTILKIVAVNFVILFIVCLFWWYGTFALIVYSAILFFFLRKYTKDLQEKYKLLLGSTNQLAEGHLDASIEGDIGLFNPIQEELKKIQKGFKKAVEEEVKNERMKTELVTNVSHDLRTPLTAIITYTDLLKNESDEEKRREYIEVLEKKSLRLKVLIEDLFEISKAASKNVVMHYMKVDIVDLLKQVGLENDGKIRDAHLDFRWKLPEEKIVMSLDSQKTYRIFENLIVNITKYAMPHTRVYVEMVDGENEVHISMKNISATELDFDVEEITDRFVRGDSSRNTEGSGLGLAIAKSFVELQHGTLKISTEADLFKADIILPKLDIRQEGE